MGHRPLARHDVVDQVRVHRRGHPRPARLDLGDEPQQRPAVVGLREPLAGHQPAPLQLRVRVQEPVGGHQLHPRVLRPARQQQRQQPRGRGLAHRHRPGHPDHERRPRLLRAQERPVRPVEPPALLDVQGQQPRQRQVHLAHLVEVDLVAEAAHPVELLGGQRQRHVLAEPPPTTPGRSPRTATRPAPRSTAVHARQPRPREPVRTAGVDVMRATWRSPGRRWPVTRAITAAVGQQLAAPGRRDRAPPHLRRRTPASDGHPVPTVHCRPTAGSAPVGAPVPTAPEPVRSTAGSPTPRCPREASARGRRMTVLLSVLGLLAVVALTLGTAISVASEFSLTALERSQVDGHVAAVGDRRARAVHRAHRSLSFQLSGSQLGITVTTLVTGYIAEPAIASLFRPGPDRARAAPTGVAAGTATVLALLLATALSMVFGELVPKNLAIADPLRTARAVVWLQSGFAHAFRWLIRRPQPRRQRASCAGSASSPPRSCARPAPRRARVRWSASSAARGTLDPGTATLLDRSLRFTDRVAEDLMTPARPGRVPSTPTTPSPTSSPSPAAAASPASPSHDRDPDAVLGVVHVKQAFGVPVADRADGRAARHVRPVPTVPESLDGDALMTTLRGSGPAARRGRRRVRRHRRASSPSRTWSRRSSATSATSTTATEQAQVRPLRPRRLARLRPAARRRGHRRRRVRRARPARTRPSPGSSWPASAASPTSTTTSSSTAGGSSSCAATATASPNCRVAEPAMPCEPNLASEEACMSDLLALLAAVALLVGNAFFVGAEFALISARRDRLEAMAEGRAPRRARPGRCCAPGPTSPACSRRPSSASRSARCCWAGSASPRSRT